MGDDKQIQTVVYTINPTKETKEVIDLVYNLIADLKDRKPLPNIAGTVLKDLGDAVQGADQLDDEAKSANLDDNLAYLTKRLSSILIPGAAGEESEKGL